VTITGVYYAELLQKLRLAVKEKRRGKLTKVPLLLHDNAPAHRSRIGQAAILESGFEEMHHPPYSPDLAPSDYHLFPNLANVSVDRDFRPMMSSSMRPKSGCKEQSELRTLLFHKH